jgi:hypothetical protein
MSETPAGLLLFGVLFLLLLFIGIFAAIIVYVGKSRSSERAPAQPPIPPQTPEPDPVPEVEAPAAIPAAETPAHPGEVMRVIRDEQTGQVRVEVGGQQYAHIREIADAQVGRRVLWAIADLIRFTGGMAANPQAVRSVAKAEPVPTSPIPSQPSAGERVEAAPPPLPAPVPTFPVATAAEEPAIRQRYSMVDYFRRGFQTSGAKSVPSPTSFIDEIEEILQEAIAGLGTPLPHDVHVLSGETGMLQIKVGPYAYNKPDEVPDPQIRELIKAAVAEWERR